MGSQNLLQPNFQTSGYTAMSQVELSSYWLGLLYPRSDVFCLRAAHVRSASRSAEML